MGFGVGCYANCCGGGAFDKFACVQRFTHHCESSFAIASQHMPHIQDDIFQIIPRLSDLWDKVREDAWQACIAEYGVDLPKKWTCQSKCTELIGTLLGLPTYDRNLSEGSFRAAWEYNCLNPPPIAFALPQEFGLVNSSNFIDATAGKRATERIFWGTPSGGGVGYAAGATALYESVIRSIVFRVPPGQTIASAYGVSRVKIDYRLSAIPGVKDGEYVDTLSITIPPAGDVYSSLNTCHKSNVIVSQPVWVGSGRCATVECGDQITITLKRAIIGSVMDALISERVTHESALANTLANQDQELTLTPEGSYLSMQSTTDEQYVFLAFYPRPLYWDDSPISGLPGVQGFSFYRNMSPLEMVYIKQVTFYNSLDEVLYFAN